MTLVIATFDNLFLKKHDSKADTLRNILSWNDGKLCPGMTNLYFDVFESKITNYNKDYKLLGLEKAAAVLFAPVELSFL